MDLFTQPPVAVTPPSLSGAVPPPRTLDKWAVKIQSFWRMYSSRKFFKKTFSRIQNERKRAHAEIEKTNSFVNSNLKISRFEFLNKSKRIIHKNFPGISLEGEKYFGRRPFEKISLKAKGDAIGRSCPLSVRIHSKNSIYFILSPENDTVVVKCFKCDGFKELKADDFLMESMKSKLVISEKEAKRTKNTQTRTVESLGDIKIINFDHSTLQIDSNAIFEFYQANRFVICPAHLTKKAPVFSNWTKRSFEMNEPINMKHNNAAIVCGEASGIFVVDVDVNEDGLSYFQKLCTKYNYKYYRETTCVLTPSGGIHLYFIYDENFSDNSVRLKSSEQKTIGIDIRSNNGCVICPPSTYPKGTYHFICFRKPQKCPDFLFDFVR